MDNAREVKRWTPENTDTRSRYAYDERILYSDGYAQIETRDPVSISQDNSDKFYRLEANYENRLDLVSWKFYDTPLYWWVIAYASNIQDPLSVPAGTLLRIPTLSRALREVNDARV